MRGRQSFRDAGGEELTLIPCLNEHPLWIAALENMVREWLAPGRTATPSAASEISGFASSRQSRPQKTNANMENA
jgi:hypothetical protein